MGMSAGPDGGTNTVLAEINVTPLVDVMLVLLVIFMVATPMMHESMQEHSEVELDLPMVQDDEMRVEIDEQEHIILSIDRDMTIFIGAEPIVDCAPYADGQGANRFDPCFDELQELVADNRRLQEEGRLYLLADTEIPYGLVVGAMNRIRLAGVTQVGMVTNPEFRDTEQAQDRE